MSKVTIAGDVNGTGVFTIAAPNGNTNRTLTLPDEAGTMALQGGAGVGKVLQVVQAVKADTFSATGTAWVDVTGLSVSITPTSATNKILVSFNVNWSGNQHFDLKLVRDSTDIAIGDTAGSRTRSTSHMYRGWSLGIYDTPTTSMMWLDSPATTSSTTYKIQVASPYSASYYVYINRTANDDDASYNGRNVSTITLMEISA